MRCAENSLQDNFRQNQTSHRLVLFVAALVVAAVVVVAVAVAVVVVGVWDMGWEAAVVVVAMVVFGVVQGEETATVACVGVLGVAVASWWEEVERVGE